MRAPRLFRDIARAQVQRLGHVATGETRAELHGLGNEMRRGLAAARQHLHDVLGNPALSRASIARHFLRGRGIEIGALHNRLAVPQGCHVTYIDTLPAETLRQRFPDHAGIQPPDLIDDGETLRTIADASCDFVIANHMLEHTEDPLGTLRTFARVTRTGGHLFLAIPDKRWTFDRDRPATAVDHLLRDHREGAQISRAGHYAEWLRVVDGITDDALFASRHAAFLRDRVNIHFHVWTQAEMAAMFQAARDELHLKLDVRLCFVDPANVEVVWVLQVG